MSTRITSDQGKYEKKVVKVILPKYRKAFGASFNKVKHVENLEQLGNLEHYGVRVGGFKQSSEMNLGALFNAFRKSSICSHLNQFLASPDWSEPWEFIFSISSSTALYVIVPMCSWDSMDMSWFRFVTILPYENPDSVAVLRLDDYLMYKWGDPDND